MTTKPVISLLIDYARKLIETPDPSFPVQVFHCRDAQSLHRVHFFQPTLMLVLKGTKQISGPESMLCPEGNLILVSAGHEFPFANLPDDFYMALAVGFDAEDFKPAEVHDLSSHERLQVMTAPDSLLALLVQLMELVGKGLPQAILDSRKKELACLIDDLGLDGILRMPHQPSWTTKVTQIIQQDLAHDWTMATICHELATSESNLRRRLQAEATSYRELLEDLRLTTGLGLIQTTHLPVNQIALSCGYQSTSRFSERFKKRFHTSPSELRKAH